MSTVSDLRNIFIPIKEYLTWLFTYLGDAMDIVWLDCKHIWYMCVFGYGEIFITQKLSLCELSCS